jgi:hypothetical protein
LPAITNPLKGHIKMNTQLEDYYLKQAEPYQSCLLAIKFIILNVDEQIIHERKFQIPNFSYKGKKLAFLWMNRKKLILGFITDKSVLPRIAGLKTKDQLDMIQIDPTKDLPKEFIESKIKELIELYSAK